MSSVASAWPAVTMSPTATDTPVTVPATGKCAVIWLTRVTDPVRVRVCSIDPVVTWPVRNAAVSDPALTPLAT
ncbi:MAG: hypothetical protein BWY91_03195 [bacterium ADurb.BinA028]|nr:MAG: hypothetical protein BWY91_03195 [bacterium ADurb.BinA028]